MGVNAVIPAAISSTRSASESQRLPLHQSGPSSYAYAVKNGHASSTGTGVGVTIDQLRAASYGSIDSHDIGSDSDPEETSPGKGKRPDYTRLQGDRSGEWEVESDDEFGLEPEIPVTWRYMSRLYLLVPIITLVWLALLILLVTYAWPPTKRERDAGQQYPHPFLWKPLAIGVFASCTVQTIRVPTWVVVSWLGVSQWTTTFISTSLHAAIHELLRMSTLPLIVPSPTSGFHSSYYLGLGWGAAEVTWGIVQGWEQLELYKEVMRPARVQLGEEEAQIQTPRSAANGNDNGTNGKAEGLGLGLSSVTERSDEDDEALSEEEEEEEEERIEQEDELERKVEILERMRSRRDLEEVLGLPFPNIPFPLHLLWRLDTLLLNLGLTLLLSAFYFNSSPIYRHSFGPIPVPVHTDDRGSAEFGGHTPVAVPDTEPSRWLGLALVLVALLHVIVSLVWKVVGRVGVGAVTWGGLIVALGSVFAGLGCWGGLV